MPEIKNELKNGLLKCSIARFPESAHPSKGNYVLIIEILFPSSPRALPRFEMHFT